MTEEKEVNLAQPEEVGVSPESAQVAEAPAPDAINDVIPEEVAAPKRRGRGLDRSQMSKEELLAHKRTIDSKVRAKKTAKSFVYSSTDEPGKAAALAILEERGLKHPHVQATVYKLLLRAAEDNQIPPNRFLFQNGLVQTLASYKAKSAQPLEPVSQDDVIGELLTRVELHALYDASIATHEQITFEEFLDIRYKCKRDTFYLGKEVFQNDFARCHEVWREFFPQLDPMTLPSNYNQKQAIDWLASQSEVKDFLLMASRRAFKALALDTVVQTPQGRKRIADIHTGDQVYGEDGLPKLVVGESEIFTNRECFKVTFSTGESVVADADHLWKTAHANGDSRKDAAKKGHHSRWHRARGIVDPTCKWCNTAEFITGGKKSTSAVTTKQIADTLRYGKRQDLNHTVAVAAPILGDERAYLVSPYVLGAWLGDGTSSEGVFTIGAEDERELISELSAIEGMAHRRNHDNGKNAGTYRFGEDGRKRDAACLKVRLREIGVLNNKHIPEEYFLGSVEQRFALLQGLMDTDGTCSKHGRSVFVNTNQRLAEDVQRLACSLGFKATINEYRASLDGQDAGPMWHVSFYALIDNPVYRVGRKQERQKTRGKKTYQNNRVIVSVEETPSVPTKCLSVEGGTYLVTDSYIPTHNSSFARLWLVSAIVTLPDIRILIVSETRPLAKDNIEAVRGYFETTPGFETRFQRLFPEFCIPVGDGSVMSLENPMRRLKLPQSIESSSMDSTVAGRRADVILYDDPISEVSCTNEQQILKSVNKRDMLAKLRERGGYTITLGTPYSARDLYFEMIERSKKNQDDTFAYRVDPAFEVKSQSLYKLTPQLLPTITEDDIESFLFPEGLNWKELRVDMRNNPPFFMSQNLCIFPLAEDDSYRCQFEHDDLYARVRLTSFFGPTPIGTQVVMSLDRAFSISRYADFSCLVVGKLMPVESKSALVIVDVKMDRWKESDLVRHATDMIEKHKPTIFIAEQDRGWESLAQAIKEQCLRRGVASPYFRWKTVSATDRAKAKRVKGLELPISDGRIWFTSAPWTEAALLQLEKFDGVTKSNSHRKDDFPDALAVMFDAAGPKYLEEVPVEDVEARRLQDEEEGALMRKQAMYAAHFGDQFDRSTKASQWGKQPETREPEPTPAKSDPRLRLFGGRGPWRM